MRGLLVKSLREVRGATLLFGIALLLVEMMLMYVLPQIQSELSDIWLQLPFARMMISAILGTEFEGDLTAQMLQAIVLVHPVVLSLLWAHEIMLCTRIPAGEIDRGTIDMLLALPVSRRTVYACETLVWLLTGLLLIAMMMGGYFAGARAMAVEHRPAPLRIVFTLANLYAMYIAVGGVAFLTSALSSRRGVAVGTVFGIVLGSFLLNFLAQFWPPAQTLAFLSVLEYYRPAVVIGGGVFPAADMAVLVLVGAVAWVVGGEVMARRSICTV